MEFKFTAQHRVLGLSECERLCGRTSREIEALASQGGWSGGPGERVSVSLGVALNMLVLSAAKGHGIELQAMAAWLPGLRDGALLHLGIHTSNWAFDGPAEAEKQFWPVLYGAPDAVRPRIARLLGCYSDSPTAVLRFFSPGDVERVPACGSAQGASSRTPRFTFNARALAEQVQRSLGYPLFTAKVANLL